MVKRGLNVPVMITTDGAPGLIRAVEVEDPDQGNMAQEPASALSGAQDAQCDLQGS